MASLRKAVVVTIETGAEIHCVSVNDAAKEMGVSRHTIGNLAHESSAGRHRRRRRTTKKSMCKGGNVRCLKENK